MSSETSFASDRDYRLYLEDMLEFCENVIDYTAGHSLASFSAERMRLDATLRKLSLLGEAAMRVPQTIRLQAPDIPWRKIVGARNRLMHAYQGTELSAIWSIVSADVPALQLALQRLLKRL